MLQNKLSELLGKELSITVGIIFFSMLLVAIFMLALNLSGPSNAGEFTFEREFIGSHEYDGLTIACYKVNRPISNVECDVEDFKN